MTDKELEKYLSNKQKETLEDAKSRIVAALKENPQGLKISQITSIVKISAKLAKEALAELSDIKYEHPTYSIEKKMSIGSFDKLKSQVKTTTVVTKELFITKDELAKLLTEQFNLKFIEFFEDGSVHLSEVISKA